MEDVKQGKSDCQTVNKSLCLLLYSVGKYRVPTIFDSAYILNKNIGFKHMHLIIYLIITWKESFK